MVLFSDPQFIQLMEKYVDSYRDPLFLYQGSQDNIVEALKAWVIRRKQLIKVRMVLRERVLRSMIVDMNIPNKEPDPVFLNHNVRWEAGIEVRLTKEPSLKTALMLMV